MELDDLARDVQAEPDAPGGASRLGLRRGAALRAEQLEREHRDGSDDRPPEPQRGRERLARRARVDDVLGVEALEGADRGTVVAVLRVVVVLDDQLGVGCPLE